jgi:multicomponent Na+:H+ antiporter subunit B
MEALLAVIILLMIAGSIYTLHARDLLSAVISYGITGFGLVICFLLLKAPDLAIAQIVVEIITLIIMIAVIRISTREDLTERTTISVEGVRYVNLRSAVYLVTAAVFTLALLFFFVQATSGLDPFGVHNLRMASAYLEEGARLTGSANLVAGILFDFRAYDTLGEATILITAVVGILTVLRLKGRKQSL